MDKKSDYKRWMKQLENASARYHIDRLQAMDLQLRRHAETLYAGSDRGKLVSTLHTELVQCIIRGDPPSRAIERLAKKMDVSRARAGNLIMTESAAISSAAQKKCFRELGVEESEVDATQDGKTYETCQAMDGKIFPF